MKKFIGVLFLGTILTLCACSKQLPPETLPSTSATTTTVETTVESTTETTVITYNICGTWSDGYNVFVFNQDGSGLCNDSAFKYIVEPNDHIITITFDEGTEDEIVWFRTYEVVNDQLILTDSYNVEEVFTRATEENAPVDNPDNAEGD